jgi:carotene biosynthesis associated membrane protein
MQPLVEDRPPRTAEPRAPLPWTERAFRIVLWVFVGTMAFSVAGTLLLQLVPAAMGVFGPYYASLVKAPTWTYMALLPVLPLLAYARTHAWPLLAFFAIWGSFVGGVSELIGTTSGIPFGAYSYTDWLGPKILGHVPYFIPPSWFAMSLLSLDLASRLSDRRWERIGMTAVFMLLWDVSLDPAMNHAFPFWHYPGGGFYYGMPASNWAGWLVVSAVIAWGYEVIGGGLRATSRHAPLLYALNGLFPVLIALLYGLTFGAVVGLIALAMPLLALAARGERLIGGHDRPLLPIA